MFETLYKDPATIAKYRRAPLLEERERYLRVVVALDAVGDVVRRVARAQLLLIKLLNLPDADIPVRVATVETAVREWCRSVPEVSAANFRRHGFRWLRFLGWLEEPVRDAHPHARQVEAFATWLRDDRGLSEATVGNCCYEGDRFFAWAAGRNLMLADITVGDVDEYLAVRIADGGLRRTSARAVAGCLRSFFRFAETRSWCRSGITGCIMPPLAYPDRPVPKGFDRDEVEKLLATTESSTPADCRDRAVLIILATCGLRAGEVGALRVEDIDWQRDMLHVFRPKTRRTDTFPLTPSVGNALMDYLLKVRPDAGPERALFLTLPAPFRPLTSSAIGMIVRSRANRLGITGKRLGAHALRHAAAQRLVDEGYGLKTVGDFLGHSSPSATATYAKLDLASLRPVADICLKELLDAETFRTFLLLLYGAGLRSGEARRLTVADVDLDSAVLAVNDTKFYKSRLVPVGADLVGVLRRYAAIRARRPRIEGTQSTFLACRDGSPLNKAIVGNAFHATLRAAGIDRSKPGCRTACLHSLRHYLLNFFMSSNRQVAIV